MVNLVLELVSEVAIAKDEEEVIIRDELGGFDDVGEGFVVVVGVELAYKKDGWSFGGEGELLASGGLSGNFAQEVWGEHHGNEFDVGIWPLVLKELVVLRAGGNDG